MADLDEFGDSPSTSRHERARTKANQFRIFGFILAGLWMVSLVLVVLPLLFFGNVAPGTPHYSIVVWISTLPMLLALTCIFVLPRMYAPG